MACRHLILIMGDQLSHHLASLRDFDEITDQILMVEVFEEARFVPHHKKKIAFLFSAMRHFAKELEEKGWAVDYVALDDDDNTHAFTSEVERAAKRWSPQRIVITLPSEWRVCQSLQSWAHDSTCPVEFLDDDRFIATKGEFERWASGRKQLRMEFFYREMRRKTGLLMEGDKPIGGKWNFDAENRKPAQQDLMIPEPPYFEPDRITQTVLDLVDRHFPDHFGDLRPFWFAVNQAQANEALDSFINHALPRFGDYQDAMLVEENFLYHSVLSHYLNCGLLDPLTVCRRVEQAYFSHNAPLNAVEGYIRQIIGWREYVRGIYWLKMPQYRHHNFLNAKRDLPDFYWSGETQMKCVAEAVRQTKKEAYAHHIQRLMVTGTFGLLAGIDPHALHEWYLAVYADAYEWVELPNVIGMSQFADGGLLGSKPYAASGNYINKMSNYCKHCAYDVKQKEGEAACPFNYLYWDFLARNREKLQSNSRLASIYRVLDKMDASKHTRIAKDAQRFLLKL